MYNYIDNLSEEEVKVMYQDVLDTLDNSLAGTTVCCCTASVKGYNLNFDPSSANCTSWCRSTHRMNYCLGLNWTYFGYPNGGYLWDCHHRC